MNTPLASDHAWWSENSPNSRKTSPMSDPSPSSLPEAAPSRRKAQKVPPFARYKGTSAWRKDRKRAREYARFLAAAKRAN